MPRLQRYHHRDPEEDEFETPALREAVGERNRAADASDSEDEEELQSESGLGESPEEDLIEDTGHPLSDDEEEEEKEDNSDSDAPEDMGFMANQQAEKKMMQSILDEIRKGKNEKKNKRRMKDEMFKMQKQEKLAALNKRKLPEELLEELTEASGKKQKTVGQKERPAARQHRSEKEAASSEDKAGEYEEGEDGDLGFGLSESDGGEQSAAPGDFLPLLGTQEEGTKVDVACLDREKRQGSSVSQLANFKMDMLYGSRHRRVTNKQARMTQAKRKARC